MKRCIYCALVLVSLTAPAAAELLAYDPFDYADIGNSIVGEETGVGFVGNWKSWGGAPNQTNLKIAEGSLSYPGLLTNGNSVTGGSLNGNWVGLSHDLESSSDETATKYLSFLMRPEGLSDGSFGVMIDGTVGADVAIGKSPDSFGRYMIETFFNTATQSSNVRVESGVTSFMVVKAELAKGVDKFTLFINPTLGEPEPATGTVKHDINIGQIKGIGIGAGGNVSVDEIRWGDTFADVTPMILSSVAGDFDGDRLLTAADIDLLVSAVNMPAPSTTFDLNQDGKVDAMDRAMWVEDLKQTWFGDANLDRRVDATDLNALALNWRSTDADSWSQGDFNGDSIVNAADLNALALNWRSGVNAAAANAAVPEPASVLLLGIGLVGLVVQRHGRR